MRRFIAASCCVIVGLQILIGLPVLTCLAFFFSFDGGRLGPASVEFRAETDSRPLIPATDFRTPADLTAQNDSSAQDESILEAREERGSLLAGTVLGANLSAADEQREFVAAFRKVAAACPDTSPAPANVIPAPMCNGLDPAASSDLLPASADRFAVEHLYLIAEQDEQAGIYERSDQWRGQARAIRRAVKAVSSRTSAVDTATQNHCPAGADIQ